MKLDRIMIAAPKSGSGKTMLTCALLQALKEEGVKVSSYKCGPDYIDPMFHKKVIGIPSKNLDTFFTDEKRTKSLFLRDREKGDFAVLEGVMGIFDGLGGIREEGSSYHLASITDTPVILAVDAKGMGRSVIPMICGFLAYDTRKLIKGVILNRITEGYYNMIKPLIETELSIKVLGYFPQLQELTLKSRHLGLEMPEEIAAMEEKLRKAAKQLRNTVSLEKVSEIAKQAVDISAEAENKTSSAEALNIEKPIIAVAKDEAFCFYYEDNLRLLEECGAALSFFSPLHDKKLPDNCAGILLGGGYPELFAKILSQNESMLFSVRMAISGGMPSVAECGGFMYLHKELTDKNHRTYPMAAVLPGSCKFAGKLVRFGYIELSEKKESFLSPNERIRGHEFHYYDSTDNGSDCLAKKPTTGKTYPCAAEGSNYWWGFPHLYYPSNPKFAERFVEKARAYRRTKR